jgi:hypothetical protein
MVSAAGDLREVAVLVKAIVADGGEHRSYFILPPFLDW